MNVLDLFCPQERSVILNSFMPGNLLVGIKQKFTTYTKDI